MAATLSTHVLDTARGVPAAGIGIALFDIDGERRMKLHETVTNADGRTDGPLATNLAAGTYELVFAVGPYFARTGTPAFFTEVPVRFHVTERGERYHVPLLLAPWGYTVYRGS